MSPAKLAATTAVASGSSARTQMRSARQRLRTARLMLEAMRARVRTMVAAASALQASPTAKVATLTARQKDSAGQPTTTTAAAEDELDEAIAGPISAHSPTHSSAGFPMTTKTDVDVSGEAAFGQGPSLYLKCSTT